MDIISPFNSILEALLSGNNELIQPAQDEYIEMVNTVPEQLAIAHFQTISSANNEQIRDLTLVLLGNYFTLLKQLDKSLSPEASQEIKSALLALFQNEDFTQYHFGIISNIIFKSKQYFENDWPELSDELSSLLNHPNPVISSTAAYCLSDCIKFHLIDHEQYIDTYLSYVQNLLESPPESIPIQITSILRLLYSIISTIEYFQYMATLIPIINLIPNFLTISQDDPTIINDFYFFSSNHMQLFMESYQILFQAMTYIISNENFSSGIKNTAIIIIDKLIPHYLANFQPLASQIFDFFASQLPQNEIHDSCACFLSHLSQIYGCNDAFALHIYTFFQENVPDPFAYIAMGSSYEGIKEHFSYNEFSKELFSFFSQGFTSQDDFTRLKSFQYFVPLIDIFFHYDDNINTTEAMEVLLSVISSENNVEVLYEEIKMLSGLLNHYVLIYNQEIEYIIKLLDQLLDICPQSEYIIIIFSCYKSIAQTDKENFLPNSQQCVLKMSQYISNPQEMEDIFFYCMEILPSFKLAIPQEDYDRLMSNLFSFIFTVVYDDEGNENEDYNLSSYGQCSILKFFLSCILNEVVIDSPEIIEKITIISFKIASTDIEFETITTDSDISMYENSTIITLSQENKFIIVSNDQIEKIQNTLIILFQVFSLDNQAIIPLVDNLFELTIKLLNQKFFRDILHNVYSLEILFVPFINNKQILTLLINHLTNSLSPKSNMYNFNNFAKLFTVLIKTIGEKWSDDEILIQWLFRFGFHLLSLVFLEIENTKQIAAATQNIIYIGNESQRVQINCALALRELFRFFPQISQEYFPYIYELVDDFQKKQEIRRTVASIIYSDYVRFSPQIDLELFGSLVEFFKQGIESNYLTIKLDSIFGLSSIILPKYVDPDEMKVFVEMLENCVPIDGNNEISSMMAFALLQIFQNYSSVCDTSIFLDHFFEYFQIEIYHIPKYCLEYYAQSLIFFVSNLKDSIPEDQAEKFIIVFQKLLTKKLDPDLLEEINSILSSISTSD